MTAKELKEQEADEAFERRRTEFNDDGFDLDLSLIEIDPIIQVATAFLASGSGR